MTNAEEKLIEIINCKVTQSQNGYVDILKMAKAIIKEFPQIEASLIESDDMLQVSTLNKLNEVNIVFNPLNATKAELYLRIKE